MKLPSHLWLSRHNIYYFRVRIAVKYKANLRRSEYRVSLKTRCPHTARRKALQLWLECDHLITTIYDMTKTLSEDNLDQLILGVFEYHLQEHRDDVTDDDVLQNPEYIEKSKQILTEREKRLAQNTGLWQPDDTLHSSSAFYVHNIDTRSATPFVQKQFKAKADGILMFFAKTNLLTQLRGHKKQNSIISIR